jgi:hypothetical protein
MVLDLNASIRVQFWEEASKCESQNNRRCPTPVQRCTSNLMRLILFVAFVYLQRCNVIVQIIDIFLCIHTVCG